MDTKEEILNFLKSNKTMLRKKFRVTKIGLFGSFARNEQNNNSDVDIIIEMEGGVKNVYDLKQELRSYLSISFKRNVDIAREKYLKPIAREIILKDVEYV